MKFIVTTMFLIVSWAATATPAMNVYTINTADQVAYHDWIRDSGPVVGKSLGAHVVGVCTPHVGAVKDKDLYVYMLTDTLATALHGLPGNETLKTELAKLKSGREVRAKQLFSVVKAQSTLVLKAGEKHAIWSTLVRTKNMEAFVTAISGMEKAFHKNGFDDIGISVFRGLSGRMTGMGRVSVVAPNSRRLGEAFDALTEERWAKRPYRSVKSKRKLIHSVGGSCETVYVK